MHACKLHRVDCSRLIEFLPVCSLIENKQDCATLYCIRMVMDLDEYVRSSVKRREKMFFCALGVLSVQSSQKGKGLGFCSRNFLWHFLPLFVLPQYTSDPFFCVGFLSDDYSSSEASGWSCKLSFQDIDHGQTDPQMCSMYAAEIYEHLRMAEVCP